MVINISWEINRRSRIRRSHSEVLDDRILKSEAKLGCLCMWSEDWVFVHSDAFFNFFNGYPKALIDSCTKTFLDRIYNTKDKVHTCSKKIVYFCLPFIGHHSLHIRSQLSKVLAPVYPHISIRVAFSPSCRLSSFFPFKDRIPIALRSHVGVSVHVSMV
jgi:hypothetical protein